MTELRIVGHRTLSVISLCWYRRAIAVAGHRINQSTNQRIIQNLTIFLIGMMGSGKSTVGRVLAERLGWEFVDTDTEIEADARMRVSDIFGHLGEGKFRQWEMEYLRYVSKRKGTVISTGGGIVLNEENRKILKKAGFTILLKASPEVIARRIESVEERPLLENSTDIVERLTDIWGEREALYEASAHLILETDDMKPAEVLQVILDHLETEYANY